MARLMNDVQVVVSTLSPEVDMRKLEIRLEEIITNYDIQRKSDKEIENDLQEKIDLYLSARKVEGLSKDTLRGYAIELSLFSDFVQKGIVKITTSDIRKYLSSNPDWKPGTIDKKLSAIKTFFAWMVTEELLLRDPSTKIKPPKKPKRLPKALNIEELEIVRDACQTKRERALIEVMYATGCRLSEIQNMKKSDLNVQEMRINVIGKGDKERKVYLSFKALHRLKSYLNSRNDDCEYLFVTERKPHRQMTNRAIERSVDQIERRSNISKNLTPHTFRHTFATLSMENGADLADVQHLLGHENPSTTLVYAHVSEERKKQAQKKYHVQ